MYVNVGTFVTKFWQFFVVIDWFLSGCEGGHQTPIFFCLTNQWKVWTFLCQIKCVDSYKVLKGCCVNVAMVCLSDFNGCLRLFWMNWRYCVSNGAVVVVWVDYGMLFFGMVNWLLCWLWFGCLGMGKYGCGRSRCWTLNFDVLVFVGGPIGSRWTYRQSVACYLPVVFCYGIALHLLHSLHRAICATDLLGICLPIT